MEWYVYVCVRARAHVCVHMYIYFYFIWKLYKAKDQISRIKSDLSEFLVNFVLNFVPLSIILYHVLFRKKIVVMLALILS